MFDVANHSAVQILYMFSWARELTKKERIEQKATVYT